MKITANASPKVEFSPGEMILIQLMIVLFVVFSLLPYGISWDYTGTSALTMEGSVTTKLEWGGLISLAALLLYRHLPITFADIRTLNPFLVAVLVWCLLSSVWSPLPGVTFKRAIQLFGIVMIGLSIQLAPKPLHLLLRWMLVTLMSILTLSLFMVILTPSIGIDYQLGGAWRGALSQKNELGQVAAISILLWQVRACIERTDIRLLIGGLLFSFFMLVMSKSSTSLIIALATSMIFHLLRKRRIHSDYSISRIILSLLCVMILGLYIFYMQESRFPTWPELSAPIAHIFGKGSDLTGRTDIWELVWMEIRKHWIIGLGYGAFWLGPDSLSQFVITALHWIPLQSHNGYMDILNEQGIVGLILTILCLLTQLVMVIKMSHGDRVQSAFWTSMLLVVIVTNFTESSLFRGFGFQNVFFIFALVAGTSVNRRLREAEESKEQLNTPSMRKFSANT